MTVTSADLLPYGQDIWDLETIAREIVDYTGRNEAEVWRRLAFEIDQAGYNVVAETKRFGVTPHVFDDKMIRFYTESDGFIYETCVESHRSYRKMKWFKIAEFIAQTRKPFSECDVLLYGDSVGNDSIFLRRMGFNVFYHDFDSFCARFAKARFMARNLVIHDFDSAQARAFDFVICFEVAEHVPDPPALIEELANLIKKDGYCIFSDSFGYIEPQWPTHLASNAKYAGKADAMFKEHGMHVAWRDIHDKPIVYTKLPVPAEALRFRAKRAMRYLSGRVKGSVIGSLKLLSRM
jgi:SAM-dependent methyltransferase